MMFPAASLAAMLSKDLILPLKSSDQRICIASAGGAQCGETPLPAGLKATFIYSRGTGCFQAAEPVVEMVESAVGYARTLAVLPINSADEEIIEKFMATRPAVVPKVRKLRPAEKR